MKRHELLALEELENRQVPSTLSVVNDGGTNYLRYETDDTAKDNNVVITEFTSGGIGQPQTTWIEVVDTAETMTCGIQGAVAVANGFQVPKSGFTAVSAKVKEGDDVVDAWCTATSLQLIGLGGHDTLIGGAANDYIDGGDG